MADQVHLDNEAESPESRVLIIMTGGTICMKYAPGVGYVPARGFLKAALGPRPSFNDGSYPEPLEVVADEGMGKKAVQSLRTPISIYGRRVRYAVLEFKELLDSSSIEAKGWAEIASTVGRNYELFDGFVVLHGTDSLAYTSSALSFMLQNLGKPVILTGSQLPMLELQSDGTDNLLGSLVIAGHFMIPEVCLYFNNRLLRGNRATKVSATDFDAFDSRNCGPLAEVESQRTRVHWERIVKPCAVNGFAVRAQADTAHVACLRIFPGIRPAMVDAVLRLDGLRGLVLETFGTGNTPDGPGSALTAALTEAIGRGLVVVSVTQCLHGSVSSGYAPARALARAGVALGMDMTTEAALTKLAYLLAQHGDGAAAPARVADMMSRSLRGELTEAAPTAFQHPTPPPGADSTATAAAAKLSAHATDLTALAYAIGDGNLDKVRDAVKGEPQHLLNAADYSGNTPLHLAATGPNVEVLRELLGRGASVHLRDWRGHTPLFRAAHAARPAHVQLLRAAGAHLHQSEAAAAAVAAAAADSRARGAWIAAGVDARALSAAALHRTTE